MSATYAINKARYAKDSIAVKCVSQGMFKTREMRVVEAIGGRWSNREKSHIMPANRELRLRDLIEQGYDGKVEFIQSKKASDYYRTKMVLVAPNDATA